MNVNTLLMGNVPNKAKINKRIKQTISELRNLTSKYTMEISQLSKQPPYSYHPIGLRRNAIKDIKNKIKVLEGWKIRNN